METVKTVAIKSTITYSPLGHRYADQNDKGRKAVSEGSRVAMLTSWGYSYCGVRMRSISQLACLGAPPRL